MTSERTVGVRLAHESARGHVTGRARYVDDIPLPENTLFVATGYAPETHGRLRHLGLDAVRAAPGVVDVLTAADVPGELDVGAVFPGDELLVDEVIQYHGQPVFAVAARSLREAQHAVRLARFDVDPLTPILSIEDSIAADRTVLPSRFWGAETLPPVGPNSVRGALSIGGQEHFYVEGQIALALPGDDGSVTVHSSTQHPDDVQHQVAKVLGLPMNKVVVITARMGGGFGGKESQAAPFGCLAALFAVRLQRPVKYRVPRHDDMIQTGKRHAFEWHYEIGFDDEGLLRQADLALHGNCGHSPDLSSGILDRALFHSTNAYFIPSVRLAGHHRKLNHVSHTAFRGFGGPQGMIGIEAALDEVAAALDLDPLEVRKKNLYRAGADVTPYEQRVEQLVLADMIEMLEVQCDYQRRREAVDAFNANHAELKKGIALTPVQFGISFTTTHLNQAGALVHVYRDGTVQVNHGGTEMGQGLHTKIRQIAATSFGVSLDAVSHTASRTDKVPNATPTAASAGTDLNGMAVLDACETIKARLGSFARSQLGSPTNTLKFEGGNARAGEFMMPFDELVQAAFLERVSLSSTGFYATPEIHFDKAKGVGQAFYYFANGVCASEVVIDCMTGEYRLLRTDVLHDVGASLNPAIDIGQIEGGFMQGLGWLTTEELVWDADGRLASNSPANYKIPTADMCPPTFNVRFFEAENPKPTVHRSKAVGEPPLMLAISVWCALRQACRAAGHRLPKLAVPATPEAVYNAVREARLA